MTHAELVERGQRWLSGTRRCDPVYAGFASCAEIPDVIGWSSCRGWRGSTVLECKTSLNDFYADRKKTFEWRHGEHGWTYPAKRISEKKALSEGYQKITVPRMGNFRFYFCMAGLISPELVEERAPDHGLIWAINRRIVRIKREAPFRDDADLGSEVQYLRFAIINQNAFWRKPAPTQLALADDRSVA